MKNKAIRVITTLFAIILTAKLGTIEYNGHTETWYNLPMGKVVERAVANGYDNDYWERADGCKMISHYIICAGARSRYGEIVQTSRGEGIILDAVAIETEQKNPLLIDLAVTW